MPAPWFPVFIAFSAIITIAAHYLRPAFFWLVYIFKPLTTILILIVALYPGTFLTHLYAGAIALGLLFSLAGDIYLMFPEYFVHGLGSFLIGHVCYWVAFFQPGVEIFWVLFPLLLFGGLVLWFLWPGVSKELKIPVSIYLLAIVGMATLAVSRALQMPSRATLSAAGGALLFVVSDSLLALNRFRKPFRLAEAGVLGTYFAGQFLIAFSLSL
ncbi:MAG: lysoplasmalogenase [Anaerolineales bacterium]